MAAGVVTLGDITFNAGPDGDGDRFTCGEVMGWYAPSVELVVIERPLSAGGVIAHSRLASRALSVVGHASGTTIANGFRAASKIEALVTMLVDSEQLLTVDEGPEVLGLMVRAASAPDIRRAGPYAIEFAIDLIATDPIKASV